MADHWQCHFRAVLGHQLPPGNTSPHHWPDFLKFMMLEDNPEDGRQWMGTNSTGAVGSVAGAVLNPPLTAQAVSRYKVLFRFQNCHRLKLLWQHIESSEDVPSLSLSHPDKAAVYHPRMLLFISCPSQAEFQIWQKRHAGTQITHIFLLHLVFFLFPLRIMTSEKISLKMQLPSLSCHAGVASLI